MYILKILTLMFLFLCIYGFTQITGTATYYSGQHHGRKTASGEIYNMHALTCAADSKFKFGDLLEITNLTNGKSVVVRVNDRGGAIKNNKIDLSLAAFKTIAKLSVGIIKVNIRKINNNEQNR
jgi:rare lipoprotein A